MSAILKITDGTTEIVLTSSTRPATASGLHRATLDQGWRPQVAEYKAGGLWQDSPLSDNRTLVDTRYKNVVESFKLNLREASESLYPTGTSNASAQDLMIRTLQEIRRLLEKAASYWTTSWQDTPVYLVAQAAYETNTRYAILYRGSVPEDTDPYFQLFEREGDPMMLGLNCIVERGHWTANIPGTGACVEASGQQNWVGAEWAENTQQPAHTILALFETSGGWMLAGAQNAVWRTNTGGAVWLAATTPPGGGGRVMAFCEQSGWVYALMVGGAGGIYRSGDNGDNWVLQNVNLSTALPNSLIAASDGYLYAGGALGAVNGTFRSNDGGVTWALVGPGRGPIFQDSNGIFHAGYGCLYRSVNGTDWIVVDQIAPSSVLCHGFVETDDYLITYVSFDHTGALPASPKWDEAPEGVSSLIYVWPGIIPVSETYVYRSSDGGLSWALVVSFPNINFVGMIAPTYGGLLASTDNANAVAYGSIDGATWKFHTFTGMARPYGIVQFSGNSQVYVGTETNGGIWTETRESGTVGRAATCEREVYVANKDVSSQITHIFVHDVSEGTYTERFPSTVPFDLFPDPITVNDYIYFGSETTQINSGPFSNLVFDITRPNAQIGVEWYYSIAGPGWGNLVDVDNTVDFGKPGVNSIHWFPPDITQANEWVPTTLNGVTAYWIRGRVYGVAGTDAPQQGNRDIYTCNWARIDVDEQQVPGDIPALLRVNFTNESDMDGYYGIGNRDEQTMDNRVVVGLRSLDRGGNFTAYLNCADEQNPPGVVATVGAGTVFGDEVVAPSGRVATHTTQGNGLTNYDTAVTLSLTTTVAGEYYGIYHAYLRAQLYEPSSSPSGDHDDVRIRLRIRSGSGGIEYVTKYKKFAGRGRWNAAKGGESMWKDFVLLDFGQVNIPATGLLKSVELPDETAIVIEVASVATTNLRVDLYDVILMPVDEWAGDFVDTAINFQSCVMAGYRLDIDSLAHPKRNIRARVGPKDSIGLTTAIYQPVTNGPAILQANADQRLWFLAARGIYMGLHDGANGAAFLTDSFADFIDAGVQPGMIVCNLSNVPDGSMAIITGVTETTITGTLTGSAPNTWGTDAIYQILCPHWRSEPWNAHSVQLTGNPRYLSMRGDR